MSYRGSAILATNLLKALAWRRAHALVVGTLALSGPLPLRDLRAQTGLSERRITGQLSAGQHRGAVVCHGDKATAVWGLPGQPKPERRRVRRSPRPAVTPRPSASWWITQDRQTFTEVARRRANEQGWSS